MEDFSKENCPINLEDSIIHKKIITMLLNIIKHSSNIPNILFYGNEGKRVLIKLFLKKLFPGKVFLKTMTQTYSKEITYFYSNFHIEIDVKSNVKNINHSITEFLKYYKSCKSIINQEYKVAVIYNFDLLSNITQNKFRCLIEKSSNFRVIIHCSKFNKILEPIRSRCLGIRIPTITLNEASLLIKQLSKKYNYKIAKVNNLIKEATTNDIISVKKLNIIFYMKLQLKENKCRHKIQFDNDVILNNITKELSNVGTKEPFKIMDNCICNLMHYLKRNYPISELYTHIINYIISLPIDNKIKSNILEIVSKNESEKHSREIVMLETMMAQVIDLLNM